MIYMDVDLQSPPSSSLYNHSRFRHLSMHSRKRERSPDVEDRPTKRMFIATTFGGSDYADFADHQPSPGSSYGVPSGTTSRYASEDWVQQAGGLSIDSPMFPQSRSANSSRELLVPVGDVDMAMDSEDCSQISHEPPPVHNTSIVSASTGPSTRSKPLPPTLARLQPQISVTPATPLAPEYATLTPQSQRFASTSPTSPEMMTPMTVSPVQPFNHIPHPTSLQSPRPVKPRFTMGPRSDCEKCRLGVKGHWAHFD